jgi:hypothetical protein
MTKTDKVSATLVFNATLTQLITPEYFSVLNMNIATCKLVIKIKGRQTSFRCLFEHRLLTV